MKISNGFPVQCLVNTLRLFFSCTFEDYPTGPPGVGVQQSYVACIEPTCTWSQSKYLLTGLIDSNCALDYGLSLLTFSPRGRRVVMDKACLLPFKVLGKGSADIN